MYRLQILVDRELSKPFVEELESSFQKKHKARSRKHCKICIETNNRYTQCCNIICFKIAIQFFFYPLNVSNNYLLPPVHLARTYDRAIKLSYDWQKHLTRPAGLRWNSCYDVMRPTNAPTRLAAMVALFGFSCREIRIRLPWAATYSSRSAKWTMNRNTARQLSNHYNKLSIDYKQWQSSFTIYRQYLFTQKIDPTAMRH